MIMRAVMFMGKGGTGKTSAALATGVVASELGHKTLVISGDAAHSIPDALGMEVGSEPTRMAQDFYVMEVDSRHELEKNWGEIRDYMSAFLATKVDEELAAELAQMPGIDELLGVLKLEDESEKWDFVVLDSAPTGQALRFLAVPELMGKLGFNLIKVQKSVMKLLKPMEAMLPFPVPDEAVYEQAESMVNRLKKAGSLMRDASISSIRLMVNPEKLSVLQARRNYTFMSLFGFNVDMVVINRFFPQGAGSYLEKWNAIQSQYASEVETSFYPIPVKRVKFFGTEMVGLDNLREMGKEIYGEQDPTKVFFKGRSFYVERTKEGYLLKVQVPFTTKGDVDLEQDGDDLNVSVKMPVGRYERSIALPSVLSGRVAKSASLKEGYLEVVFSRSLR